MGAGAAANTLPAVQLPRPPPRCLCRYDINCRYAAHFKKFVAVYLDTLDEADREQLAACLQRCGPDGMPQFPLPPFHQKMHRWGHARVECHAAALLQQVQPNLLRRWDVCR